MNTISPQSSTGSVEVQDLLFCSHGKEKCDNCQVDHREDNSFTCGLDPVDDRSSLTIEYGYDKHGEITCKLHKSPNCSSCFGFKKAIAKLNKNVEKKAKANKNKPVSNFV